LFAKVHYSKGDFGTMQVKRGKVYHLRIRPFGCDRVITVSTQATNIPEAKRIEQEVLTACRHQDFRNLGPESRAVCIRIHELAKWVIPEDLSLAKNERMSVSQPSSPDALTLWDAIQTFMQYPGIAESKGLERHAFSLGHLVDFFGKDMPIQDIRTIQVRQYQVARQKAGRRPATIDRELASLSKLFTILMEMEIVHKSPMKTVTKLGRKTGRGGYLSYTDVRNIVERVSDWLKPIVWVAYYTGMRRGEIVALKRNQVSLARRMILLEPEDTKEHDWKRIPIHRSLVPILTEVMGGKIQSIGNGPVFLLQGRQPQPSSVKNTWRKAVERIELKDPRPRFHDLRHTWKMNARRSGMDPEIREAILGHKDRALSVVERYGRINEAELIQAIDLMTFDHGETEIWGPKADSRAKVAQNG
jgi:integrase